MKRSSKPLNPKEGLLPDETPLLQFDNAAPKGTIICPPPRTSIADHMGSYWNQEDPLDHIREPSHNFGNIFTFEKCQIQFGQLFTFTNVSKSIKTGAKMFFFWEGFPQIIWQLLGQHLSCSLELGLISLVVCSQIFGQTLFCHMYFDTFS